MNKIAILIVAFSIFGIFLSSCVSKSADKSEEQVAPATGVPPTKSADLASNDASTSADQNKIQELDNKINSMQQQINDLQTSLDRLGLPKISNRSLIPRVPFRIEVKFGEMQTPTVWTFKENGEVEIRDAAETEFATYKIFTNNNTIKINSKKYNYYGLVLYEEYATSIYENGWIEWAQKYQIFPPKYNPETQKYELN